MNSFKKILSDSFIYGIGIAASQGIIFFTIPVFTRIFSPSEYGIIEMLYTISLFISLFMTLGLDSAQSFYFMEAKNKKNISIEDVTSSMFMLRLFVSVVISLFSLLLIPLFQNYFFDVNVSKDYFYILILMIFFNMLINQNIEIFRLTFKPWKYNLYSFIQSFLSVGLALFFIYIYDMKIKGYYLGFTFASMVTFLFILFSTRKYLKFRINKELWPSFLSFGIPLAITGLSFEVMMGSDRWFIMKYLSSEYLGIYAAAVKISLAVAFVVVAFRKAWWPHAMDLIQSEDNSPFISKISLYYVIAGSLLVLFVTFISPFLMKTFVDSRYYEGWKIIGVYSWSHIFFGFFAVSGLGIFKGKKTYLTIYAYGTGAVVNIILNYFMIKTMGILGSAFATCISILITNILSMILGNKYYKINWSWKSYFLIIFMSWIIMYMYLI